MLSSLRLCTPPLACLAPTQLASVSDRLLLSHRRFRSGDEDHVSATQQHWLDRKFPGLREWLEAKNRRWWLKGITAWCRCACLITSLHPADECESSIDSCMQKVSSPSWARHPIAGLDRDVLPAVSCEAYRQDFRRKVTNSSTGSLLDTYLFFIYPRSSGPRLMACR